MRAGGGPAPLRLRSKIDADLNREALGSSWPVAATSIGVCRVPVPDRGDRRGGAVVPALRAAGRRRPLLSPLARQPVVRGRDLREGQRGLAVRVSGRRPARVGHRLSSLGRRCARIRTESERRCGPRRSCAR